MSFLEASGLALLISLPLLAWLALLQRGAKRLEVGTLFIWQRVAARQIARERKLRIDLLLWLNAVALLFGALAAARPAVVEALSGNPVIAVYIERLSPAQVEGEMDEPSVDDLAARAKEAAPGATLEFYFSGWLNESALGGKRHALEPGAINEELAQFRRQSATAHARLLFLCESTPEAEKIGLVLPRVSRAQNGVVFRVEVRQMRVYVRSSGNEAPQVDGAGLVGARYSNGETLREYEAKAETVRINAPATPAIEIRARKPLFVKSGGKWSSDQHKALFDALLANANVARAENAALGFDVDAPRHLGIARGRAADLAGAELSYASQHALFAQLPLTAFDWLADARLIERGEGTPLLSATRGGALIGDLVVLSEDGRALTFAGDPFSRAPAAAAALLLDNSIGVLTGIRPSENARLEIVKGVDLPSQRAAFAAPFDPRGSLDVSRTGEAPSEFTHWVALAACLLALCAAWIAYRG